MFYRSSRAVEQKSPAIQINTMPLILVACYPAQIWLSPELPFAVGKTCNQARRQDNLCSLCTRSSWPHPEPTPPVLNLGPGLWAQSHPPIRMHVFWDDTKRVFFRIQADGSEHFPHLLPRANPVHPTSFLTTGTVNLCGLCMLLMHRGLFFV